MKLRLMTFLSLLSICVVNTLRPDDFFLRNLEKILPQIQILNQALKEDDVSALKFFIQNNSNFQWNEKYLSLPWKNESQTPLSAAAWFGAVKCLKYLLKNNIGNIKMSVSIPSSHGYTALHYAQNPPTRDLTRNQNMKNFQKVVKILQPYYK